MTDTTIGRDKVVSLAYVLRDPSGKELDSATREEPFHYLHGHGAIVRGLEARLEGKEVGARLDVVVPAEDGYGPRQHLKLQELRRSQFPADAVIEKGATFVMRTKDGGSQPVTVAKVQGASVYVDMNHPLAGVPLHFEVEVLGVRDATPDEKVHGHAHGPDGHHHH